MKLKKLYLKNFRNYSELTLEVFDRSNIITGSNAQGKTNLIEAVYILATLKSFRNSKLLDCIKENENLAVIEAEIESELYGRKNIKLIINRDAENEYFVNGNKIVKKSEILGNVYAVIFSPDELKIIKNSPEARRDFLDTDISQVSKVYSELIDRYERVLLNRNRVLKNNKFEKDIDLQLSVWEEQLSVIGAQISLAREKFIKKINGYAKKVIEVMSGGSENLNIVYTGPQGESRVEKTEKLLNEYKNSRFKDLEVGYTNIGIHRDDLKFFINDVEVKPYASQGQQRTLVLALKLAELEVFANEKEKPILLLDDVFQNLTIPVKNFCINTSKINKF